MFLAFPTLSLRFPSFIQVQLYYMKIMLVMNLKYMIIFFKTTFELKRVSIIQIRTVASQYFYLMREKMVESRISLAPQFESRFFPFRGISKSNYRVFELPTPDHKWIDRVCLMQGRIFRIRKYFWKICNVMLDKPKLKRE